MPFAYPVWEKQTCLMELQRNTTTATQGLIYQSKKWSRHVSRSTDCNWKSFLLLKGKNSNFLDLHINMTVVSAVAGLNSSLLQRLLSHKVISPADWEVAGTSSLLPQNSALSKAAVAHELQALYSTVGIHPHQQTFTCQNTAVGREGTVSKCQN